MTVTDAAWSRLIGRTNPVILDVGANDGEDSLRFLKLFPDARIICFEPDTRALRLLRMHVNDRCAIVPCAVSAADGEVVFWPSKGHPPGQPKTSEGWHKSGSTHVPTGHLGAHPWCQFGEPVTVPTVRLDTWAATHLSTGVVSLIWADVQGAERDLIEGAQSLLARTCYFYTEYSDQPLYDRQPTLHEIGDALPVGFEMTEVFQFDALFTNTTLVRELA